MDAAPRAISPAGTFVGNMINGPIHIPIPIPIPYPNPISFQFQRNCNCDCGCDCDCCNCNRVQLCALTGVGGELNSCHTDVFSLQSSLESSVFSFGFFTLSRTRPFASSGNCQVAVGSWRWPFKCPIQMKVNLSDLMRCCNATWPDW